MIAKNILGILVVSCLIVAFSGCTSQNTVNSKVLADYNISASFENPVIDKYVTLPNGTKSVTIEYKNITGENYAYFQFGTYNVIAQNGQSSTNYASNIIDLKSIDANSTPISGNLTLNVNGAQSVRIRDSQGKGNIKIIITQ